MIPCFALGNMFKDMASKIAQKSSAFKSLVLITKNVICMCLGLNCISANMSDTC